MPNFMGLVLAPRLKETIPSNLGTKFATLGGANVSAFINITWGPNNKPKLLKVGPKFFQPFLLIV
jgi:hypothetical protein